ncbi:endonuclease domain-containing protein [Rhizobium cremeum]|uniref:endonuclease domain-containing protein n=1 Tax=Rhizobium cremeum TaxID=2813827 RepID=UPI000DDBF4A3|nr:endonuclease domain-containing protein [Rhizobium cremeum]MCJ7993625.1 endonuclease domain-containing protein [Rhizobium cremeum]MCJ7998682.1 endonuclease domain-containing protein [Rhizobium cremeum]
MPHYRVPDLNRGNARRMRRVMTASELKFWNAVRAHRLMGLPFRRQMPIAGYIVDFACPEHRLVVEIDGESHTFDQTIERDRQRNDILQGLGWQTVRFSNDDVLNRIEDVCMHILRITGVERRG